MTALATLLDTGTRAGADLAGRSLSLVINRLYGRGRPRPLHPIGTVREARWIIGAGAKIHSHTGVPCLDRRGEVHCLVRRSRAVGLSAPWPDIEGIAVRLDPRGDVGDLLFAGTGSGVVGRHLLALRRDPGVCTTLLPLRTLTGSLTLRLVPDGDTAWHLEWARLAGRWQRVGRLELGAAIDVDPVFDPIEHAPAGLSHAPVLAAVRRPSYRQAHRQRRNSEAGAR